MSERPPPRVPGAPGPDAVRHAMRANPALRRALARLSPAHRADAGRVIARRIEAAIAAQQRASRDGEGE